MPVFDKERQQAYKVPLSSTVFLYIVGDPPASVATSFTDWFYRLVECFPVKLVPFDGRRGRMPDLTSTNGVIITGSPASLTHPEPWMEGAIELIRHSALQAIPLLGVCFGHQLIGAAFGASVVANPNGWQVSRHPIHIVPEASEDPLFTQVTFPFDANLSHRDVIAPDTVREANGLRVLATTGDSIQAIAAGPNIRGIQFHPEFTGAIMRGYIRERAQELAADAATRKIPNNHPDKLAETAADCPIAERVFHNFVRYFVLGTENIP